MGQIIEFIIELIDSFTINKASHEFLDRKLDPSPGNPPANPDSSHDIKLT